MRRVRLPGLDIETSAIGFGCASLGSRVSARNGLEALLRANDAGVTWFDLAPAYGAGEAETIFAEFLRDRRQRIQVLTKVGLAPPARSGLLRASYAMLRPIRSIAGGLRAIVKSSGLTRNRVLSLTPALIESSIGASLRKLGVDHVDALALHDPDPDTVVREEIVRTLERVIARGQARSIGIAGSLDACLAGAGPGLPYRLFQTAVDDDGAGFAAIRQRAARPVTTIGHSVMRAAGGTSNAERIRSAIMANPQGVTLLSMFNPAHLATNLSAAPDALQDMDTDLDLAS